MLSQMREKKRANRFTKYVPCASDGRAALEVMDKMSGGKSSSLLLGNKEGVTERDKVGYLHTFCIRWCIHPASTIFTAVTTRHKYILLTGHSYLSYRSLVSMDAQQCGTKMQKK